MSVINIIFLVLIILLGGVVAYLADRLGRTLGKKRLSLFGMRPRHTAELLTVSAGVVIPLVTVLLVLALSRDVRAWLLHGQELINQRNQIEQQLNVQKKQVVQLRTEFDKAQADVRRAENSLKETQSSLKSVKKLSDKFQKDAALYQGQANTARAKVLSLQGQYRTAQAQYRTAKAQYNVVKGNLSSAKTHLAEAQKSYTALNKTYAALNTSYNELQKQTNESYRENRRLLTENQKLNDQAQQNTDLLQKSNEQLRKVNEDLGKAQSDLSRAQTNLDYLHDQIDLATKTVVQQGMLLATFRNKPLIFAQGDELARLVIATPISPEQARVYLDTLLREARSRARLLGAAASLRDSDEVADLLPEPDVNGNDMSVDDQKRKFIEVVSDPRVREPLVAIAYAPYNAFRGEFVPLMLRTFNNPLVYKKNDILAETRINGNLADSDIYEAISEFVKDKVEKRAIQDNIIPVVTRGEPSYGAVSIKDIFRLVRQIRDTGRTVSLVAYSLSDTRKAGPLQLGFRLR